MRRPAAISESVLNSRIAEELGYKVYHCEGIGECIKMLRSGRLLETRERLAALIDYERETGARNAVNTLLSMMSCECKGWSYSINCCRCMEGRLTLILFEGGPEEALQRLGYKLDMGLRNRLKSHRLWHGGERAEEMIRRLARLLKDYCGSWLWAPEGLVTP